MLVALLAFTSGGEEDKKRRAQEQMLCRNMRDGLTMIKNALSQGGGKKSEKAKMGKNEKGVEKKCKLFII